MMKALLLCFSVLILVCADTNGDSAWDGDASLGDNVHLFWKKTDSDISIRLEVKTHSWIGIGWNPSPAGEMTDADMVILSKVGSEYQVGDYWSVGYETPTIDETNNLYNTSYGIDDKITWLEFSRLLDTNDDNMDSPIAKDSNFIIWAYGEQNEFSLAYHGHLRGHNDVAFEDGHQELSAHGHSHGHGDYGNDYNDHNDNYSNENHDYNHNDKGDKVENLDHEHNDKGKNEHHHDNEEKEHHHDNEEKEHDDKDDEHDNRQYGDSHHEDKHEKDDYHHHHHHHDNGDFHEDDRADYHHHHHDDRDDYHYHEDDFDSDYHDDRDDYHHHEDDSDSDYHYYSDDRAHGEFYDDRHFHYFYDEDDGSDIEDPYSKY